MKKILCLMALLLTIGVNRAYSTDIVEVDEVSIQQGGQGVMEICCDFGTECTAFTIDLALPSGISVQKDTSDELVFSTGFSGTMHQIQGTKLANGNYRFSCISLDKEAIPQTGVLLRVTLCSDGSATVGDALSATLTSIEFTSMSSAAIHLADVNFTINITDSHVVLDESSTVLPASTSAPVPLRVLRTINAGEWSTLCLPFNMTEAQLKSVFGDDVLLEEFTDYEPEYDAADNIIGIAVNFQRADLTDGLYANYPYLIKTSHSISSFELESVLEPEEEYAVVEYDNGKHGKQRVVFGSFIGTYHAETVVPDKCLFLSGNKFWYSSGKTKMKAFRAYFDFSDVLAKVESAGAKIHINVDGQATGIGETKNEELRMKNSEVIYDLQGRPISISSDTSLPTVLPKGVYIINGKKMFIKQSQED
ncbi:MAG: hypothetical protein IKG96_00010 [Bacteroidaceae bacterium]|nr:hypothetical protein [Bacteroidaceae bacterium]